MGVEENSDQHVDVFDMLPDALVSEIFNRVEDAKSLSACSVLCKRFGDLVAQTQNVSLEITRRETLHEVSKGGSGWHINKSKGFICRYVLKPIHAFVHRMVSRKSKTCSRCCDEEEDDDMFRLPNDLLKKFKEIRSLSVKLPGHDGDISSENGSGALLKWKADFGKQLESCVILGATGFYKSEPKPKTEVPETIKSEELSPPASTSTNLTNKQLKKRVVWTISCLIASSARHHMLKQIISLNQMIQNIKISDGSKQGTIQMTNKQVAELRNEMKLNDKVVGMDRTKVPAVTIKMWYMPVLGLPESGGVMKGATLAIIRPTAAVAAKEKDDDVSLAIEAFGEDFTMEAVRKLVDTKKSYTLEMNSF